METLFKKYSPPEAAAETQPARPDFGTPEGVKAILAGGGFHPLRAEIATVEFAFRSEEEWWAASWSHGGRLGLEEIERAGGTATLERLKVEAFECLQTLKSPDGFPEKLEVVFATGEKA